MAPASRDHVPSEVLQPSIPIWIYWTGWSFTGTNIGNHVLDITPTIRQHLRENLVVTRQLYQVVGWFPNEAHTEKEVIARE